MAMGGMLQAAGWGHSATTWREVPAFSCQMLYPCDLLLFPSPSSAQVPWVRDLLQPSLSQVLHVSPFSLQPPCSPSGSSLLPPVPLQHLPVPSACCRGEGSGSASCWGIGTECGVGNRRRRGSLLPGLGWGDHSCCYCEGLLPCSETGKLEGGDESCSGTKVLSPFVSLMQRIKR